MTTITRLTAGDRARWAELWEGYLTFYKTVLPPETYDLTWKKLFDGRVQGFGARDGDGRLLIEAVAAAAKAYGAGRVYWLTQDNNAVARQLYDRLAAHRGFIRYDFTG